jgi:hypothetical protein
MQTMPRDIRNPIAAGWSSTSSSTVVSALIAVFLTMSTSG